MAENNKRVAIYARVSSRKQGEEGFSLEAQKDKCQKYAEIKDWEVFDIYIDVKSGKNIEARKEFKRMLEDASHKKFDVVLAVKSDRTFRNTKEALNTVDELKKYNIHFAFATESIDTTTSNGMLFFTFMNAVATWEREKTADRVGDIIENRFEKGILTGKMPFGYKWNKKEVKAEVDINEARIVKRIFELALRYDYKAICSMIEIPKKDKFGKVTYKNLSSSSFYNIIRNTAYIGMVEFKDQIKKGKHEPLISKEVFESVQKRFPRKERTSFDEFS